MTPDFAHLVRDEARVAGERGDIERRACWSGMRSNISALGPGQSHGKRRWSWTLVRGTLTLRDIVHDASKYSSISNDHRVIGESLIHQGRLKHTIYLIG